MAPQGKHTSSIAVKRARESILKKHVSHAFDEKCSRDLRGKDERSERPKGIRTLSLHTIHPLKLFLLDRTERNIVGNKIPTRTFWTASCCIHARTLTCTAQIHIQVVKRPYKMSACYEWNFGDYISYTNPEQLTTIASIMRSAISNIFGTDVRETIVPIML